MKRTRKIFLVLSILFISGLFLLPEAQAKEEFVRALVVSARNEKGSIPGNLFYYPAQTQHLSLKVLGGVHKGEIIDFENHLVGQRGYDTLLNTGEKALIQIATSPQGKISHITLVSYLRDKFIYLLLAVFLFFLILIGGLRKGLRAVTALMITVGLIFFVMLPLFKVGSPPLATGIIVSLLVSIIVLYLVGGGGIKSLSAILSTIIGLAIVVGIALLGAHFMRLNGYHMEESKTLVFLLHHTPACALSDLRGLLLVGIIIGGLGVMMDVAISVASAVYEIGDAHPGIGQKELIRRGMNVGRDIMATMANSLVLAYLGLTLPLILAFRVLHTPFSRISNWAFLDVEVLAALAGSIGFVLVIPLTVVITTSLLFKRIPFPKTKVAGVILFLFLSLGMGFSEARASHQEELLPDSDLRSHPLVFVYERGDEFAKGRVLEIEKRGEDQELITFKVLEGRYRDKIVTIPNYLSGKPQYDFIFRKNDSALLRVSQEEFYIADYVRDRFLIILAGIFLILLILVGRLKGLRTALALGLTLALVLFLFLPLIETGHSPILVSILVSILATLVTLYLVAGFGIKATSAILGTSLSILLVAGLSLLTGNLLRITGFSSSGIRMLNYFSRHYGKGLISDMPGIITSVIIIGALGVVMDVAISVSSSIQEIKGASPRISQGELIRRGFNVGRDIMATMANSLILAYIGGSLLLVMVYLVGEFPFLQIINTEFIALEITRGLIGSLGFVFVIPVTAIISGMWLSRPAK